MSARQSEYKAFAAAGMREGHSLKEIGAAWRAAHGSPRHNPYSSEGHVRQKRNSILGELLRKGTSFVDARRIAEGESRVIRGTVRTVGHEAGRVRNINPPAPTPGRCIVCGRTRDTRRGVCSECATAARRVLAAKRRNPDTLLLVLAVGAGAYWWLRNRAPSSAAVTAASGTPNAACGPNVAYIPYSTWWTRYIGGGSAPPNGSSFPNVMVQDCPPALISPWLGGNSPTFPTH